MNNFLSSVYIYFYVQYIQILSTLFWLLKCTELLWAVESPADSLIIYIIGKLKASSIR